MEFKNLQYGQSNEILRFIINSGKIDINDVQNCMKEMKRKELLEKHPYKIWQGRDGKWYTYIPDEKKGRIQRERYSRAEIESLIIDYWKTQMENPTIREVFSEWNDRRLELKKISNATHLRNCQIFNRHYGEFGDRKIKAVTEEDFCEFLEEQIADKDLTAKAFSNLKTVTRGLLKRAKKRKLISFNVEELFQELDTSETDFRKVIKEDYQEVFSEEEMPVMVNYLKENLDAKNIGILLMFATGIRVGELVALKHDVFDGNTFKIRRTETRYMGEDGKYAYAVKEFPKSEAGVRTVVIPDDYAWLCSRIKMLNPFGEYVFVDKAGKRMTTNCIRRRLEKNCLKIGIYKKSPHKIRKTYGTILLDHNVDNRFIMEQMGHTDIMCTENHYHRNRRSIDAKTQIISNIPEFQAK
ncbi:Tyrosine recombinase XerC [Acetatifactor muris]|uniref:Tyrosine recombinase XerC n=2 Tax=Acetatifactor muris TaxID=879566 RepID=A0A2K4ZPI7_9FIRM|nr:Tyrosine recombinase XerC [Acetatifactor muris]